MKKKNQEIDNYIENFPKEVQIILQKIREEIQKTAPRAEEVMSYGIPTFRLNGNLVHYGGFKNHIGFFPSPSGIAKFKKELSQYKTSKGTIQFQIKDPIPYDLIKKITKFRISENLKKHI